MFAFERTIASRHTLYIVYRGSLHDLQIVLNELKACLITVANIVRASFLQEHSGKPVWVFEVIRE